MPGLLDASLRGAAGLLLIIPGFVSDLAALGLLIPQLRRGIIRRLWDWLDNEPAASVVIEGDYHRLDRTARPSRCKGLPSVEHGTED